LKVLFDNCTSPAFASTLDGFISHFGHRAFHIKDVPELPRGRHSSDIEWIEYLGRSKELWIFISGDGRVTKNKAERAALRSAGLHGFILASSYQKSPLHLVAATLVQRWPDIVQVTELLAPPAMHEIPIGKATRLSALPI